MSIEQERIFRREGPHRELPHERWWSSPPKEEIKKRAREDAERSLERFREQMERLARPRRSND